MTKKGISGSTLKIIAVIAMVLDHTAWTLIDPTLIKSGVEINGFYSPLFQLSVSPVLCVLSPLFHTIGRITFPIMLFLLVEGVKYSRNKKKYIRNMAVFALISEIPFNLAFQKSIIVFGGTVPYLEGQNVFVTLTVGLIALVLIERVQKREEQPSYLEKLSLLGLPVFCVSLSCYMINRLVSKTGSENKISYIFILSAALTLIGLLVTKNFDRNKKIKSGLILLTAAVFALVTFVFDSDYDFTGVIALVIMYLFRENKTSAYLSGCAYLTVNNYLEIGSFLALPLIGAYNGKRGISLKYLFYTVYPAHLLILFIIRTALKI